MIKKGQTFLFLIALAILSFRCSESLKKVAEKPNVIILYVDDLGYGDISSYGATEIETPNIDALAETGLKFTNAHSMASTCTPSRYSILTGEYAFRSQKAHILPGDASLLIPLDKTTIGNVFQQAGYRTACIGKWHLGLGTEEGPDWNGEVKPGPNEVGFDYSFIFPATADRVPTVYLENNKVVALDADDSIEVSYVKQVGDEPTVKSHPENLKMRSSDGHDGTIVNGIGRIGWMSGGKLARWTDEELMDGFLEKVKGFITSNKENPFFLYYPINEIHVPRMPKTLFKGKSKLGYRGDVILEMDYLVGEMVNTLKNEGLLDNTIIIFTSDNGPVLDDGYVDYAVEKSSGHQPAGPFRGGKYSLYEGGTRVPFIVNWPNRISKGESDALLGQVDLLASFADFLGIDIPSGQARDSEKLMELLLGQKNEGRSHIVEQNNDGVLTYIKDGWKYIEPHEGKKVIDIVNIETGFDKDPQLFNLNEDKEEQTNLAQKHPERVAAMRNELQEIRK